MGEGFPGYFFPFEWPEYSGTTRADRKRIQRESKTTPARTGTRNRTLKKRRWKWLYLSD
jgi:hypothetical protein